MDIEVKRLEDEVATLSAAIEESIRNGKKSVDCLNDIPRPDLVSNKDLTLTHMKAGSRVVGWVDDF